MNQLAVDYRDMGSRIRKKRKSCGLTQIELAEKDQVSTQHLSNVENARSKIGLEKLVAIANVLDSSLDELVCGSMKRGRVIYNSEIAEFLEDRSDEELRVLLSILREVSYYRNSASDGPSAKKDV